MKSVVWLFQQAIKPPLSIKFTNFNTLYQSNYFFIKFLLNNKDFDFLLIDLLVKKSLWSFVLLRISEVYMAIKKHSELFFFYFFNSTFFFWSLKSKTVKNLDINVNTVEITSFSCICIWHLSHTSDIQII